MYPVPGHAAVSIILARSFRVNVWICLIAGLMPDLVDKPIRYVFHLLPYGRSIMHSLTGLIVMTVLVSAVRGRSDGAAWGAGHLGHIGADALIDAIFGNGRAVIPWFYPFTTINWPLNANWSFMLESLLVELGLLVIAVVICLKTRLLRSIHKVHSHGGDFSAGPPQNASTLKPQ